MNTAVCKSQITYIDGDKGILMYRGIRIEDLIDKSTFEEVSYLLINGALPTKSQQENWTDRIMKHTYLHQNLLELLRTFRYDAHPMGTLISCVAALGTFYAEANPALKGQELYNKSSDSFKNKQIFRLLGKMPTIAACAYRNRIGKPYNDPKSTLSYTENFLYMLDKLDETEYKPHPKLARALDKLFIIHADHELNCSTAAMRHLSSAKTDVFTCVAGAAGALYGPLHGGACEAVLHMLEDIKHKDNIPKFLQDVKDKKQRLMGFGHRIYKTYDPRARIAKQVADEIFGLLGKEPLIEIAVELEKQALADDYFKERHLYPNVDFYTGIVYRALGFPTDMFPVLFAIPRAAGWLAHWLESLNDPDKIYRPKQLYTGDKEKPYVPIHDRRNETKRNTSTSTSVQSQRRVIS
jgi:citrate synthase